jgi:formylglycine-generating enzyme required for sulfatase activity
MGPVVPYTIQDTLDEKLPMRRVSWFDARAFAEALQDRNPTFFFRLPTEAEWERAARGGNTSRFYWGDDLDLSDCDACAWTWRNSGAEVQEGAQLIPSAYGLYDISGNLVEWVEDRYHENYNGAPADGSAWGTPEFVDGVDDPLDTIYGVVRGGCYNWNPEDARSASRYSEYPDSRRPYTGFRVLMHYPY